MPLPSPEDAAQVRLNSRHHSRNFHQNQNRVALHRSAPQIGIKNIGGRGGIPPELLLASPNAYQNVVVLP